MHTFTALYDKRADAESMQAKLEQLGIVDIDHGVHDKDTAGLGMAGSSHESKGLWGSAKGAVPPDEDRRLYEEAMRRGGFLLTVNVDDQEASRVQQLLEGSNAVDIAERERELKQDGFVPPLASARPASTEEPVIPIVEERLVVGKREVDRGGLRVRAYTVQTPVREQVQLREEHVDIERRPVHERVRDADTLFQDRSVAMTETSEEAVVSKTARVVEEVSLHKSASEHAETVQDTVRHTEVEVDRIDGQPQRPPIR